MRVHDRYQHYQRDQRAFFDELITEEWDTYHSAEWDELRRYEIELLFDRIRPQTILDIGCGCGFHDQAMAGFDFVEQVHGIDYSAKSVEKADEAYPHPKIERWVSDFMSDEPRQKYDLVVSFQVFEHIDEPDSYFRYAIDACNPGGVIAIVMPHRDRLPNRIRRLKGLEPQLLDPQHFREYSFPEVAALAQAHGLVVSDSIGYGLNGLKMIDRLPSKRRLVLGTRFRWLANGMCVLMRRKEGPSA